MSDAKHSQPEQQRVTMANIASASGCSLMTVSRALRGNPGVSAQMRERVLRVAEGLGYRPDPELSRLMSRLHASRVAEPETIAWLTTGSGQGDWRRNPSAFAIFEGAAARAAELGYRLETFWSGDCGHCGKRMAQVLLHRGIRSVLVAPLESSASGVFNAFDWGPFVSVSCGFSLPRPRLHRVCSQQHQAVSLIWQQLWQRGYRRIGLALSRVSNRRTGNMWLSGFLACQSEMLAEVPELASNAAHSKKRPAKTRVCKVGAGQCKVEVALAPVPPLWLDEEMEQAFANWLELHEVEAVIGTGEILKLSAKIGLEIPNDFAFAALNVIDMPAHVCGVDHHMDALGAAAIELISEQLRLHSYGLPKIPRNLMVECDWHDGLTTLKR